MNVYAFAWGNLYQAVIDLICLDSPLESRVCAAYHHLAPLTLSNLEAHTFARLKALREQFPPHLSSADEDDGTVTLEPLTRKQAVHMASEILGMYDEVAKAVGSEAPAARQEIIGRLSYS